MLERSVGRIAASSWLDSRTDRSVTSLPPTSLSPVDHVLLLLLLFLFVVFPWAFIVFYRFLTFSFFPPLVFSSSWAEFPPDKARSRRRVLFGQRASSVDWTWWPAE